MLWVFKEKEQFGSCSRRFTQSLVLTLRSRSQVRNWKNIYSLPFQLFLFLGAILVYGPNFNSSNYNFIHDRTHDRALVPQIEHGTTVSFTKDHLPSSLDSSVCSDAKRANLLRLKSVCPKTKNKNKVSVNHIVFCTVFKKIENINTTTTTTIIIIIAIEMMIINTLYNVWSNYV